MVTVPNEINENMLTMNKETGYHSRKIETVRKDRMEILGLTSVNLKFKSLLDGLNSRTETTMKSQ